MSVEKGAEKVQVRELTEEEQGEYMSQQIISQYKAMQNKVRQIATKIGQLEGDRNEHKLVLATLEPLDPNRKVFRAIGGVLVERNVLQVIPAVKHNLEQLEAIIKQLTNTLKQEQAAAKAFREQYRIGVKKES
eukprot:gb/GEZN01026238.1/.p2 GENE.gb/GEZN01026238.1/~~gb/GEZN01026238.1/.p2  ORF type:complete len:133 (+),score=26.59 gb/GEZN01026238.1/:86-484(+)